MKTILFLLATVASNSMISGLFRNTAQPLVRQLARKIIRYGAKVLTLCLIGALTFVSGLVMAFSDMAVQLSEVGTLVFSPQLGFGIGLLVIGSVFAYLGAFSDIFSPWKEWEREKGKHHHPESALAQVVEVIVSAMSERAQSKAPPRDSVERTRPYRHETESIQRVPDSIH